MYGRLACLAGFFCAAAFGALTPLPGTTPQSTPAGSYFPNPIRVLVTDPSGSPVPGATVQYFYGTAGFYIDHAVPCFYDATYRCTASADAEGVVTLPPVRATEPGNYRIAMWRGFDSLQIDLAVEFASPAFSLEAVGGAWQQAVIGNRYAQPLRLRVMRDGEPVVGAAVKFRHAAGALVAFEGGDSPTVTTDASGIAESPPFIAVRGLGPGEIEVVSFDPVAGGNVRMRVAYVNTNAEGQTTFALAPLWWAGVQENGWGVSISQRGSAIFPVIFTYDVDGAPTWHLFSGEWGQGFGAYYGGTAYSPRGAPYFAYDASAFTVGTRTGSITLSFQTPSQVQMSAALGVLGAPQALAEKSLVPLDFAPDVPQAERGVGDIWWGGPAQNGWGISIAEDQGNLFLAWFTYDATGRATWFAMPEGRWLDASTWAGPIYRTTGAPFANGPYDASRFKAERVGEFTVAFSGTDRARFTYELDGNRGTLALERFDY